MGVGTANAAAWRQAGRLVLAAAVPGADGLRRRSIQLIDAALLMAGTVAPLVWLTANVIRHHSWVGLGLDRSFLGQLLVVLVVVVITRAVAVAEVLARTRHQPGAGVRAAAAVLTLLAVTVPSVIGADSAVDAREAIDRAFQPNSDTPLFDTDATLPSNTFPATPATTAPASVPVGATTPSTTQPVFTIPREQIPNQVHPRRPDSGVDPEELEDITTILLLGGDAGPGRSGLRTDSMILVSIHEPSGRAALISVPRNLEHLLFPPGSVLSDQYPQGFTEIANAVYPVVSSHDDLRDAYSVSGLTPGAVAIAQGIGYSLDVTIDDYVLIDMKGFVEVIDALGGVTVDVPKAVPSPGNPPNATHTVPEVIEAGTQRMDGTLALAYVRSRHSDTDYQRAGRQRRVLAALARQVSLADAFVGYNAVVSALGESLRTSLSTDEFTNLLALIGGETAIVESMGLVPPLVTPSEPDYDQLAKIVGKVQLALVTDIPSGY
jgi:LCP family protein required for cell wall assembly